MSKDIEKPDFEKVEGEVNEGARSRNLRIIVAVIAVSMSLFHLYTSGFGVLEPMKHRTIHVTFGLLLAFLLYPATKKRTGIGVDGYVLAALCLIPILHLFGDYIRITNRIEYVSSLTLMDRAASILLLVLILEATRRVTGWGLVIVALASIAYALTGPLLPGFLEHRGISPDNLIDQLVMTLNGVYSTPISVSSTFVFVFVLFGAFLVKTGAGQLIIDLAKALAGHAKGGPAKVAVVSSGMLGMISGSSVGNVVTTGTFTIPLMKNLGFKPEFAGAVEAVASSGGQIMPPIMGAAAFVMAEITGISYVSIMKAAILPAVLYYLSLYVMIDLRAKRLGLPTLPRAGRAEIIRIIKESYTLFLPIVVLLGLLILGYTPLKAGFYSFWVLVAVASLRKKTRLSLASFISGLELAARSAVVIVCACATAGIVIGVIGITGMGIRFASDILLLSGGIKLVVLFLVMLITLVLGMGLPTTAAYVVVAAVSVPTLIQLGVPRLEANLFAMYFAVISNITPPVAVAAYAAAGLANGDPTRTGMIATRLGVAGFIVPFLFVYHPGILLQGSFGFVLTAIVTSILGVICIAVAMEGWLLKPVSVPGRLYWTAVGFLLVTPGIYTDLLGLVLLLAGLAIEIQAKRRTRGVTA